MAAVGLNRDERYGRPSAPPHWWPRTADGAGFFAPCDLEAGGTWFGFGEYGLFVAITNGHQAGRFRRERSRGDLVVDALRAGHLDRAVATVAARDAFTYASCYLLMAQHGTTAYLAADSQGSFQTTRYEGCRHTLRNDGIDAGDASWTAESHLGRGTASDIHTLRMALTTHDSPFALCRHGAEAGTRSCAVILLGTALAHSRLYYADGRPCETELRRIPLDVG